MIDANAIDEVLQHFNYSDLPSGVQVVSHKFYETAHDVARRLPPSRQLMMCLEHLLIAQGAAQRAYLQVAKRIWGAESAEGMPEAWQAQFEAVKRGTAPATASADLTGGVFHGFRVHPSAYSGPSVAEEANVQKELKWYYGPTQDDPDPGKMWHKGCGGEIWFIEGAHICMKCKASGFGEL